MTWPAPAPAGNWPHATASVAPVILSQDDFNRADNAASLGSTDGAGSLDPQAWTVPAGSTLGIQTNTAYAPAGQAYGPGVLNLGSADIDVAVTVAQVGANGGLTLRYTDVSNYFYIFTTAGACNAFRHQAGSDSLVGSGPGGIPTGGLLEVFAQGSLFRVYIQGVLQFSFTDTFNQTATRHGIFIANTVNPHLDNFQAQTFGSAGSPAAWPPVKNWP